MLPLFIGVILVGVWIFLVRMVWKNKIGLFRNQMEPKLAERCYKMLKAFLLVAGISVAVYIGLILQIAIFRPPDYSGPVSFYIGLVSLCVFAVVTCPHKGYHSSS